MRRARARRTKSSIARSTRIGPLAADPERLFEEIRVKHKIRAFHVYKCAMLPESAQPRPRAAAMAHIRKTLAGSYCASPRRRSRPVKLAASIVRPP
jgi:hypothetical protein